MSKVKLYTGTQYNQKIILWGETVTFDNEGMAEVTKETGEKAVVAVPTDYSMEPTIRKTAKVSSFSHQPAGGGVGKRAASVVEKEHQANLAADKKKKDDAAKAEEPKATKKDKKKSKKSKTEDTAETPPSDESSEDSDSEGDDSKGIWK